MSTCRVSCFSTRLSRCSCSVVTIARTHFVVRLRKCKLLDLLVSCEARFVLTRPPSVWHGPAQGCSAGVTRNSWQAGRKGRPCAVPHPCGALDVLVLSTAGVVTLTVGAAFFHKLHSSQ